VDHIKIGEYKPASLSEADLRARSKAEIGRREKALARNQEIAKAYKAAAGKQAQSAQQPEAQISISATLDFLGTVVECNTNFVMQCLPNPFMATSNMSNSGAAAQNMLALADPFKIFSTATAFTTAFWGFSPAATPARPTAVVVSLAAERQRRSPFVVAGTAPAPK
jgi:hypothetical protein